MGSIVTDLVRVEEGIYIVKAQILLNDIILGTGLAGTTTIEGAEDAAIKRALTHAGFGQTYVGSAFTSASLSASSMGMTTVAAAPPPPVANGQREAAAPSSWSSASAFPSSPDSAANSAQGSEPPASSSSTLDLAPGGEDLSDEIAQSDVELRRIGWGPKEGRDFLESRFQKKSRHQLTPGELREFLNHLKQQPTRSAF
ncbi:MAG: hypothetical protein HC921_09545 [Synechococcaceae cyanobacterium SM2_3_1]|nr:hypothetical protein [Synechococcaceae cyanobacterium SM2_3_1]